MLAAALVTLVVTGVLTPLLASWARRRRFLDVPNHRSSHLVATPRIGGAALLIGVLAGAAVLHLLSSGLRPETLAVLAGGVAIALLGLVDDFRPLGAITRLIVQVAIAVGVVTTVGAAPLRWLTPDGWVASFATVFWIVTLTNAYNFMDGIDGIAGLQGLVAGIGWTVVGLLSSSSQIAPLGLLLAAGSGGFLLHNWHPAKVFMGDAGAGFFGFMFAVLPLLAPSAGVAVWSGAVLLMWPFLFDTGFTLLRRAGRGENVLAAHKSHLYQRLVLTGRSQDHVSLLYGGLALAGAVAAIFAVGRQPVALFAACAVILMAGGALWWGVAAREVTGRGEPARSRLPQ